MDTEVDLVGYPIVYNKKQEKVAYLENAFKISYTRRLNGLWTASFCLPADDPKVDECQFFYFVELFEADGRRIDLFRIIDSEFVKARDGTKYVKFSLEHVLATLLDDVMFGYHQIGGPGVKTGDVIQYILDKQSAGYWKLGTVLFDKELMYKFENENLLSALFAVAKPIGNAFWSWSTSGGWKINLTPLPGQITSWIEYGRNLTTIKRTLDCSKLCTRLYALGYGEGINQLTFERINPAGKPYIDTDTATQFGVISRVWVDRSIEDERLLYEIASSMLQKHKYPVASYEVNAADIYSITGEESDKFDLGYLVRVVDNDLGITFNARIVKIEKNDVFGAPGDVRLEISNAAESLSTVLSELASRTRINECYAQGATNLDSHNFADNCDPDNPAVIRFYIPQETVRVNKVSLSYEITSFRAYSKAIGGGGVTGLTTAAGGATVETSADGVWVLSPPHWLPADFMCTTGSHDHGGSTGSGGDPSHTHPISSDGSHAHCMESVYHTHDVSIPDHQHGFAIPDHAHTIEYGIYTGPTPTSLVVKVDGNEVPGLGLSENDVDIIPYLAKDVEGRITRGTWHTVEITPNNLGRVVANVVLQLFVQSKGGGKY